MAYENTSPMDPEGSFGSLPYVALSCVWDYLAFLSTYNGLIATPQQTSKSIKSAPRRLMRGMMDFCLAA
jgi:hypothetical protein